MLLVLGGEPRQAYAAGEGSGPAPSSPSAPRVHDVALVVATDVPEADLLRDTVRELLARRGVNLVTSPSPLSAWLVARIETVGGGPRALRVTVSRGRDAVVLEQRTFPHEAHPALAREEAAEAVRTAVEAELLDEDVGPPPVATNDSGAASSERPATPLPTPHPSAPIVVARDAVVGVAVPDARAADVPRPGSSLALEIATLLAGGPFSSNSGIVLHPGFGVELHARRGPRWSVGAWGQFALPFELEGDEVTAHTKVLSLRGLVGLEVWRTGRMALAAHVGGGADRLAVEPKSDSLPGATLGAASSRVDPVASVALTLRAGLGVGAVVFVRALLDADLVDRRYGISDRGAFVDVFVPWRVRPSLALGFAFSLLGEPAFASGSRGTP